MITSKDGTQIFYEDWDPKDAQPILVGLLAKSAEQSDGGRPQCGNKIYRYPPSGKP